MNKPIRNKPRMFERILGIVALVSLVAAWFVGLARARIDLEPVLGQVLPEATHFEKINETTYAAYDPSSADSLLGYVTIGEATGYGGPMRVAVAVDPGGEVIGVQVIEHKETPSWFTRVMRSGFLQSLVGKNYQEAFLVGSDVDGITGATYTTRAIAAAVQQASQVIAKNELGLPVPQATSPRVSIGVPEIILVSLFALGYFGHKPKFKYKKAIRWVAMLAGMLFLGFIFDNPVTLAYINQFLLGFWPEWQTHLYWYLLIGGLLFVFTVDNKNPYCEWFCPFGAAQECMGALGGAKPRSAGNYRNTLSWIHRGIAWLAVLLALIFRNPGLTSYEVFGTLFTLTGSTWQFALLGIVLVASLFIKRPWCNYLCPIKPVMDLYRTFRAWINEIWQTQKVKRRT